ncbi:MAG: hypothetical protein LBU47_03155 [Christensenellaceae bacterium]|jgi:hypothetical protein|nr:hypothetical protein [Christensenellaceae bacterium]
MPETKQSYIDITIGPIIDTLLLSSTPAGLWGTSYFMSELSRELCKRLGKFMTLLSPYYDDLDDTRPRLGVGLYSDHLFLNRAPSRWMKLRP